MRSPTLVGFFLLSVALAQSYCENDRRCIRNRNLARERKAGMNELEERERELSLVCFASSSSLVCRGEGGREPPSLLDIKQREKTSCSSSSSSNHSHSSSMLFSAPLLLRTTYVTREPSHQERKKTGNGYGEEVPPPTPHPSASTRLLHSRPYPTTRERSRILFTKKKLLEGRGGKRRWLCEIEQKCT